MNTQPLSSIVAVLVLSVTGIAQAQGPWPTMNQPSFFSPVQEFFSPKPYTTNYGPYAPSYNGATQIVPGVPQCANGRCQNSCPNGQCSRSNSCPNGRCSIPSTSYYSPAIGNGNCANGQCGNRMGYSTPGCANGSCGLNNSGWNNSWLSTPGYSSSIGLRPLTPTYAPAPTYRSGTLNRLAPIDGFSAPSAPMYRDRSSQLPVGPSVTFDSSVKLR